MGFEGPSVWVRFPSPAPLFVVWRVPALSQVAQFPQSQRLPVPAIRHVGAECCFATISQYAIHVLLITIREYAALTGIAARIFQPRTASLSPRQLGAQRLARNDSYLPARAAVHIGEFDASRMEVSGDLR